VRGILLAGGTGSRLWPITRAVSKQLMPVFDKPMIYYPLSTLVTAGVGEILVITTPEDQGQFQRLLGDGAQFGLRLEYVAQPRPEGIAQAFVLGADFIGDEAVALILGDNIFHGVGLGRQLAAAGDPVGGRIFAYPVANPQAYGVVRFDATGRVLSIEEKPQRPMSRYAVPGLYFYDNRVVEIARGLTPSARGELEITAVNEEYRRRGELTVTVLDRGTAWLDTGTFTSLVQAAEFVRVIEERQGMKIGCVEEAAWRAGLIDDAQLRSLAEPLTRSGYGDYLLDLLAGERHELAGEFGGAESGR
jgi:glucose-1-phosphate thymidylyltransferase